MMKSRQIILLLCILVVGGAAGLIYGWFINPTEYIDTTFNMLSIDYQTDMVLMTGEIYSSDLDLTAAIQRLSQIGNTNINDLMEDSLVYAHEMSFSKQDVDQLEKLKNAIALIYGGNTIQP